MADISCDIAVLGAGSLGLCVAAELTRRGHDVRVIDPGRPNASSVAAGMIAPAFESLLDGADSTRAALLREAAALWPAFAKRISVIPDPTPAEWRGGDGVRVAEALQSLGFHSQRDGDLVRTRDDFRIDPANALRCLAAALREPILVAEAISVERDEPGWRVLTRLGVVESRHLVISTGAAGPVAGLPDDVAEAISAVIPIAGQIGRSPEPFPPGVFRGPGGYVAAGGDGLVVGATMVVGSRDPEPDPAASERLLGVAQGLLGHPVPGAVRWVGGIRGATADGLPLAGATRTPGLHLALAPRRNGWLLGPLVGEVVADAIEDRPAGAHAAALDPMRRMAAPD